MRKLKGLTKKLWIVAGWGIFVCLFCFGALLPSPAEAYNVISEEIVTEPVSAGVTLQEYTQQTGEGTLKIAVLRLDLTNPYIRISPLIGDDNESFNRAVPVLEMARQAGAVAAINGDFFILKEGKHPLGFAVKDGRVLTSPMLRDDFYTFTLTRSLTPFIGLFKFQGVVEAIPPGEAQGNRVESARFPLAGINKPPYEMRVGEAVYASDIDRLQVYDTVWGPLSRGAQDGLSGWVEVVVDGEIVREVRVDQPGVAIPRSGCVLRGHGSAAQFLLEYCMTGARVSLDYNIAPLGAEILTAVGGKNVLVENGKNVGDYDPELAGKLARSAVGYSQDGKTIYLVAVEGGQGSRGMHQSEVADFLTQRLGVWHALNLDGGGSTGLVARPLGEAVPVLVNKPAQSFQRSVPIGIGVFSTAPQGALHGLVIRGPQEVLAGLPANYQVRGYDQYYNPVSIDAGQVTWKLRAGKGSLQNGELRATEGGNAVLEAVLGGVRQEFPVRVIGMADLAALEILPDRINLDPGEEISLAAQVRGKDGRVRQLPFQEVRWELEGEIGSIAEGKFSAAGTDAAGKIRARFLDFTVEVPVTVGMPLPPDVKGHWAESCIAGLLKRDIVRGYPDGSFCPDRPVTRAEFVTLLAGAFGWQTPDLSSLPFQDEIPDWALSGVKSAWSRGIVKGYEDATFRPDRMVSRTELAAFMALALQLPDDSQPLTFKDAEQVPGWAVDAVQRIAAAGIMQGSDGYFRPTAAATRAEVATLIYRVLLDVRSGTETDTQ